jgi:nucleotide-binding universal stress UspA family protein
MSAIKLDRILVPTDFSTHSLKAFRYATELARAFSAEIVLLHIFDSRVVENIYHIHPFSPDKARQEMLQVAERKMEELMSAEEARELVIRAEYAEGIPPVEVKSMAESVEADLIVMGTHGATGLSHLLYGSTAEGVVRGAPCPVLTINP